MNSHFWGRKTFLLVTSASSGFGKECAIEFCKRVAPGSMAIIAARTIESLEPVKKIILDNWKDSNFKLGLFSQNFRNPDPKAFTRKVNEFMAMNLAKPTEFESALILHGPMTQFNLKLSALDLDSGPDLGYYFMQNVFAPVVFTSHFMRIFPKDFSMLRTVVNVTSDAAEGPVKAFPVICAAGIARESFMCSVSAENEQILVLNYNPGYLGPFVEKLHDSKVPDVESMYQSIIKNPNQITSEEETVAKLITVLEERQFLNGEHLNYRDLVKTTKSDAK